MKSTNLKLQNYHSDLPAYVYVAVTENFLHPKTIGNFNGDIKNKKASSEFYVHFTNNN